VQQADLTSTRSAAISIQCISRPPSRFPNRFVSFGNTSSVISTWDAFSGLMVARGIWSSQHARGV
jgi:hypothetical protein